MIGTGEASTGGSVVNEFPGADMPFGMLQWGPDTANPQANGGGYNYSASQLLGFSLDRLSGAGCPSLRADSMIVTSRSQRAGPVIDLYKTNRDSWLVQGWAVTGSAVLAEMNIPEGEKVVESLTARSLLPGGLVGLSYDDFSALFPQVKREALHLEMRDSYGTEAEIPAPGEVSCGKT